jgi:hypothetical protein
VMFLSIRSAVRRRGKAPADWRQLISMPGSPGSGVGGALFLLFGIMSVPRDRMRDRAYRKSTRPSRGAPSPFAARATTVARAPQGDGAGLRQGAQAPLLLFAPLNTSQRHPEAPAPFRRGPRRMAACTAGSQMNVAVRGSVDLHSNFSNEISPAWGQHRRPMRGSKGSEGAPLASLFWPLAPATSVARQRHIWFSHNKRAPASSDAGAGQMAANRIAPDQLLRSASPSHGSE